MKNDIVVYSSVTSTSPSAPLDAIALSRAFLEGLSGIVGMKNHIAPVEVPFVRPITVYESSEVIGVVEGDIPTTLVHAGRRIRIMRNGICLIISVGLSSVEFYGIAPDGYFVVGYYRKDGYPV